MSEAADLLIHCADPAEAERLAAALAPENDGFVVVAVEGDMLAITAEADSNLGLLRTLDDVLGCLRAAGMD